MRNNIQLLYIDLFCGAGGTSTGVESAKHEGQKCAKVIACVNHDKNAIASHAANHPDAVHFTEDIRTLELDPLVAHLEKMKELHPQAKVVLWASLECTNFSRAKGGQPRDADSRTLAEHLFRYVEALRPDFIQVENVEEFMCWGDLDEDGKPVSKYKGRCYLSWIKRVQAYGYHYDWRILNAADYGAYTSRKRFFGQFARGFLPIAWPEQTHEKCANDFELFHQYKQWKPVREVLDLNDEGTSIFAKKKPLCEKTLERIYSGLIKFVAGGKKKYEAWILKYNSMNQDGHHQPPSIEEPCPTVAVQNRLGLVKVNFLSKQFSGDPMSKNQSVEQPAGAVTTIDHHAFVTAYYGNGYNSSIDEPNPTLTTKERHGIVSTITPEDGIDLDAPMPDVPLDKVQVMTRRFLDSQYGNGTPTSIETPSPTVVNNPKQSLVTCEPWLMSTDFSNVGSSIESPSPVVTASHKQHYLVNPFSFKSDGGSIEKPCFTLIARMDKMPPYLISTEQGRLGIAIYEADSPMTRKIKEFMAMYNIIDIKMRMLNIGELKRIMGFPSDYVLIGTQAEQKKYIGNAVEVNMARVLCEALSNRLSKN